VLDEAAARDSSLMSGSDSCLKTDIDLDFLLLKNSLRSTKALLRCHTVVFLRFQLHGTSGVLGDSERRPAYGISVFVFLRREIIMSRM
jgi:hypothetical protein